MPILKLRVKQETSLAKIGKNGRNTCRMKATEPIAARKCSHGELAVSRGRAFDDANTTLVCILSIGQ